MAVAVTRQGEQHFYSFGLASWETRAPVTNDTLFEVGSISKTYSATLAAYAQALGRLSLADPVERHVPELAGSAFGKVSLLGLATHTAGGFPLQVPDTVRDRAQLMAYLQAWQPSYAEARAALRQSQHRHAGRGHRQCHGPGLCAADAGHAVARWACPAPIAGAGRPDGALRAGLRQAQPAGARESRRAGRRPTASRPAPATCCASWS